MLTEPVPEPTIELQGRRQGPPPRLEIVGTKFHEFGTMAAQVKGSHSWEFKNVGEGPLDVWLQETTCACTVATLKTETGEPQKTITIAPGRSNAIEVSWEAKKWGRFGQAATLGTSDPDNANVTLTILGTILAPVEVQPSETVSFPEISNEETHRAVVTVVSPDRSELKLTQLTTSRPGLIVADAKPMTAEEVARKRVKSGYNLTVEIKPGMPLGRFSEELVIETDHPNRPSVKVAITGRAVGPIAAVPDRLLMASVASRRGGSQDLTLVVRGGRETHFEVASKPEKVQVSIDRERETRGQGTVPPEGRRAA